MGFDGKNKASVKSFLYQTGKGFFYGCFFGEFRAKTMQEKIHWCETTTRGFRLTVVATHAHHTRLLSAHLKCLAASHPARRNESDGDGEKGHFRKDFVQKVLFPRKFSWKKYFSTIVKVVKKDLFHFTQSPFSWLK